MSPGDPHMLVDIHDRYRLSRVINAQGTYTPLGVSRSDPSVAQAVAQGLAEFFAIDELQAAFSEVIADMTVAQAGTVVHCASAAITLSVAATMTGLERSRIAALPDTTGMPNRVVLPAGHAVDYGHPILTDIRLAGARSVLAGTDERCTMAALQAALAAPGCACLLLVSSRLVRGERLDFQAAVALAHKHGLPVIIDAAAQDLRMDELLASGADLVVFSAHKYLASPTAGLVLGQADLVAACSAQQRGIGRAMKPSKEAIIGVLAALDSRRALDLPAWRDAQLRKVQQFVAQVGQIAGLSASCEPDPAGLPLARACLRIAAPDDHWNAPALAAALKAGSPSIWVMDHAAAQGRIFLELAPLREDECAAILARLFELFEIAATTSGSSKSSP